MIELPAIDVTGLTKRYPSGTLAVDQLSFQVEQGEIFGFLGPNGAGKTTTIRAILDLIRPTAGSVRVLGLDCQQQSLEVRRRLGYLPGDLSLYAKMNGDALLRFFARLRPNQVDWDYVQRLCRRIDADLDAPYRDLSHGNKQKLGIVLALMAKPPVVILDEPTSGLDPLAQHRVLDLLREVRGEGRTVFFSSHILPEVERICDRVAIVRKGRLAAVEEVAALRERQVHRIRLHFAEPVPDDVFGSLPGVRLLDGDDGDIHVEVTGEADGVVKAAAQYHLVSIATEQPSLDDVFMAYYAGEVREPESEALRA